MKLRFILYGLTPLARLFTLLSQIFIFYFLSLNSKTTHFLSFSPQFSTFARFFIKSDCLNDSEVTVEMTQKWLTSDSKVTAKVTAILHHVIPYTSKRSSKVNPHLLLIKWLFLNSFLCNHSRLNCITLAFLNRLSIVYYFPLFYN